ncbi:hypothetical protein [Blautia hansenii]|uniref:hypothetical protein n=1 Tax=Blautia hansenii TaxID=1322 RepID=UPI0039840435
MEFLVCNAEKMEVGLLSEHVSIDLDIGDTNDAEIITEKGHLDYGMYLICPGTEYGVLLEEKNSWTNDEEETWKGNTFRGFLKQLIICPPPGYDYLTVSGDAHEVLRQVLGNAFDGMFTIPKESSGITLNGSFDRYTDALTGFEKLLDVKGARLNIEIKQGGPNEPFFVVLSAVPKSNLSTEIEYSQDSQVAIHFSESRRGINHLICLGKGELKDRQVVHLYAQKDGSIVQDKPYYTGLKERTAVYDYKDVESVEELIKGGKERLKELMDYRKMEMDVQDLEAQIGDTIAGRDYDTGFYLQKPIVGKIVRIEDGEFSVEYKVEGEE